MTPLELLENQACHAIAQAVACQHSPAQGSSPDAVAIRVAEEIAGKILERQQRILRVVPGDGETATEDLRNALQLLAAAEDERYTPGGIDEETLRAVQDRIAVALVKLQQQAGSVAR